MKKNFILELLATSLFISLISLFDFPVKAQIIELGDDIHINLSNERRHRSRTNMRIYTENGRLNVGLENERRPQTRIRVFDKYNYPSIDIRKRIPVYEERVRSSLPF